MDPVKFEGHNTIFAEDQPEYIPLPARIGIMPLPGANGELDGAIAVSTCWKLSEEELEQVKKEGVIYLTVLTFGNPLQPIHGSAMPPTLFDIPSPEPQPESTPDNGQ